MSDIHPLLAGFPVVTTIPVLWGDKDAFGHVNNLVYLRWCETSRVEYLRQIGMRVDLPPSGPGPILASIRCDYKAQLNFPGTVEVGSRVVRIGNSSFQMEHMVVSRDLNVIAAAVDSTLVFFDYDRQKPIPLPAQTRDIIARLERREFEGCRRAEPDTVVSRP